MTAGLRPEALRLLPDPGGAFPLDYVEELGGARLLHGRIGGQAAVAQTAAEAPVADRMALVADLADLHLFDPVSGRRLD
ncbi:hypothetical protein EV657_106103 [Rhodovulum visakhapatnamense]|uniref:TOBE domain-containing protein n=1 Tax=Rhodovulum visakhapatnamense TaxID=364297 RepID=A0A4R8G5W2_9RHOB|nr:hypothetical protein EV657_106103 [Rhodovulum visakhapatnamense]